jgi:hypothetical protein
MAETSLAAQLCSSGYRVQDIAGTQLMHPGGDWRTHDLLVDGVPVDVKSARQAIRNARAYTSFVVKGAKREAKGTPVWLAAVLTPYYTEEQIAHSDSLHGVFLGFCKPEGLFTLQDRLPALNCALEWAHPASDPSYLAPWMFSLEHMADTDSRISAARHILTMARPHRKPLRALHLNWEALGGACKYICGDPNGVDLPSSLRDVLTAAAECDVPRLTALAFGVLDHLCRSLRDDTRERWDSATLRRALYAMTNETATQWPLLCYDPLETIDNLLSIGDTLHAHGIGQGFRYFSMPQSGVITARRERTDPYATTLYAYCGGWVETPTPRPCTYTPLIAYTHDNCDRCGKLICPDCFLCSRQCLAYQARTLKHQQGSPSVDSRGALP